MRTLLFIAFSFVACTVQPSGARCQQNQDCNTDQGDICVAEPSPHPACGNAPSCICCPANLTAAGMVPGCEVTMHVTDAGVRD